MGCLKEDNIDDNAWAERLLEQLWRIRIGHCLSKWSSFKYWEIWSDKIGEFIGSMKKNFLHELIFQLLVVRLRILIYYFRLNVINYLVLKFYQSVINIHVKEIYDLVFEVLYPMIDIMDYPIVIMYNKTNLNKKFN